MASSLITTKANALLTAEFKTATVYAALLTGNPGDTGSTADEVADLYDYARKEITFGDDAAERTIANTAQVLFDEADGGSWGTVTYLGISTSVTHGDTINVAYGLLTASKPIGDGDQMRFPIGSITVTIAAGA